MIAGGTVIISKSEILSKTSKGFMVSLLDRSFLGLIPQRANKSKFTVFEFVEVQVRRLVACIVTRSFIPQSANGDKSAVETI